MSLLSSNYLDDFEVLYGAPNSPIGFGDLHIDGCENQILYQGNSPHEFSTLIYTANVRTLARLPPIAPPTG
jgi:hypothetical protein